MNEKVKQNSINFGFVLGVILLLPTILGYAIDTIFIVSYWTGGMQFLVTITLGVICVIYSKSLLSGFISFKEAFSSYFTMLVVGISISTVFNFFLFNVMDADFEKKVMDAFLQVMQSQKEWMLEKANNPTQEEINTIESNFKIMTESYIVSKPYAFIPLLKSWLVQVAFYAFFGLIASRILKKEPPYQLSNEA
jgi:uncharacterized membrane protein (DUF106 family)